MRFLFINGGDWLLVGCYRGTRSGGRDSVGAEDAGRLAQVAVAGDVGRLAIGEAEDELGRELAQSTWGASAVVVETELCASGGGVEAGLDDMVVGFADRLAREVVPLLEPVGFGDARPQRGRPGDSRGRGGEESEGPQEAPAGGREDWCGHGLIMAGGVGHLRGDIELFRTKAEKRRQTMSQEIRL